MASMPGQKDPLEKEMEIHSCILAWKISWTKEPVDYCLRIRKELVLLSEGACTRTYTHTHIWLCQCKAFQRVKTPVARSTAQLSEKQTMSSMLQLLWARRSPSGDGFFFSSFNTAHWEPAGTFFGRLVIDLFISEGQFLVGGFPHSQSLLGTSWSWNFWILPWL